MIFIELIAFLIFLDFLAAKITKKHESRTFLCHFYYLTRHCCKKKP